MKAVLGASTALSLCLSTRRVHRVCVCVQVRQTVGPPSFLDRATFDCSRAPFRHFWHAHKLRAELHARFDTPTGVLKGPSLER